MLCWLVEFFRLFLVPQHTAVRNPDWKIIDSLWHLGDKQYQLPWGSGLCLMSKTDSDSSFGRENLIFCGSSVSSLPPSPWKKKQVSPSPASERGPWNCASPGPLCKSWAAPGGESPTMDVWGHCSIYPHPAGASKGLLPRVTRGGNTVRHLRLPGMLCVQSCLGCSELFSKKLQNTEPTVWLKKCASKTGSKLCRLWADCADCAHCIADNNNTSDEMS